ncbi:MAG: CinA family protein [Micrococcaceae bacterium]
MSSAQFIIEYCMHHKLKIAVAESLTGGKLADALVSIPGASSAFELGVVSYSAAQKHAVLGVPEDIIDNFGVVSRQTAENMAEGVAQLGNADVSLSTTGVAGPDSLEEHPAGTVFVSAKVYGKITTKNFAFTGDREQVRVQSVEEALNLLQTCLENHSE